MTYTEDPKANPGSPNKIGHEDTEQKHQNTAGKEHEMSRKEISGGYGRFTSVTPEPSP